MTNENVDRPVRQPADEDPVLSVREAARLLNISERTVHRYIARYALKVQHIYTVKGREIRIPEAEVDRLARALSDRLSDTLPMSAAVRQGLADRLADGPPMPAGVGQRAGAGVGQAVGQGGGSENSPESALVPLRLSRTDLRDLLAEAIAAGVAKALEQARQGGADREVASPSRLRRAVRAAELVAIPAALIGLWAFIIGAGTKLGVWAEVARSLGV